MDCPCCSQKTYDECCAPFHQGKEPPTALALMRSRYAAYALSLPLYIQKTTHPKSPYFEKDLRKWFDAILQFCHTSEFIRLEIKDSGETWVSFSAYLRQDKKPVTLHEISTFEKVDSHWRYLSGNITVEKPA